MSVCCGFSTLCVIARCEEFLYIFIIANWNYYCTLLECYLLVCMHNIILYSLVVTVGACVFNCERV